MTVSPGTTHSYDPDGSLVGRVGERGLTVSAQYDATNRPVFWASESLSLSTYLDYAHEPQGRRIRVHAEKVTGINTTEATAYYLWAGDRIVAEYDVAGTRTVRYAYLPGDYAPIQQATATATTYLHSDRLQTPRRGTSAAGVVTWKGDYRSFGDGAPNTDPDGNGQAVVVKHRFPGQYADESGLSYNYFRDYEPATGRYVEADPIGLNGGPNTFAYGNGDPLTTYDPRGEAGQTASDEQCCNFAQGQVAGNAEGTVACCNGRMILCTWGPLGGTAPRSIINRCRRRHEESHMGDGRCDPGCPAMMRVPNRPSSECSAYGVELDCLRERKNDCGRDIRCKMVIDAEIRDRENHRFDWCGRAMGPPR